MFILLQETLILGGHHINNARILKKYIPLLTTKKKQKEF